MITTITSKQEFAVNPRFAEPTKKYIVTKALSDSSHRKNFYNARNEADWTKVRIKQYVEEESFQREKRIQEIVAEGPTQENMLYALAWSDVTKTIIFPYAQGGNVKRLLRKAGKCTPRQAVSIISPLCKALSSLHSQEIVHRDVKLANILLQRTESSAYQVILSDFDISWHKSLNHFDEKGIAYGTPFYMAPEVCRGEKSDPRSDIYAAGVTLYYLITGRPPFGGPGSKRVMIAHLKDQIPNAAQYNEQVTSGVQHVIERALAKNLNQRYQRAEDLEQELRTVVELP